MQIAGGDGSECGQLGRGTFVGEHVERPVLNCRPAKMRVVKAASEMGFAARLAGLRLPAVPASSKSRMRTFEDSRLPVEFRGYLDKIHPGSAERHPAARSAPISSSAGGRNLVLPILLAGAFRREVDSWEQTLPEMLRAAAPSPAR